MNPKVIHFMCFVTYIFAIYIFDMMEPMVFSPTSSGPSSPIGTGWDDLDDVDNNATENAAGGWDDQDHVNSSHVTSVVTTVHETNQYCGWGEQDHVNSSHVTSSHGSADPSASSSHEIFRVPGSSCNQLCVPDAIMSESNKRRKLNSVARDAATNLLQNVKEISAASVPNLHAEAAVGDAIVPHGAAHDAPGENKVDKAVSRLASIQKHVTTATLQIALAPTTDAHSDEGASKVCEDNLGLQARHVQSISALEGRLGELIYLLAGAQLWNVV